MNRYANGRVRYYLFRQSTFVLLATLIGILLSPNIGLICFLVAVVGDTIDTMYLRRISPVERPTPVRPQPAA